MYKKIMVAVSDDEISQNALKDASFIAGACGAELCIVHAVAEPHNYDGDQNEDGGAIQREGSNLLAKARSCVDEGLAVETRLLQAEGRYGLSGVSEAISTAVTEWEPDLLVVGTKGRRGLERLVIGSVAGKLVNTVDTSILLVRLP